MLTAKEIKEKAEKSYKDFLISVLRRQVFFPFHIKGNKGNANLPLQILYPALKHLIEHSKEKTGFGYTLTYKEINTRHSGVITLPEDIFFENIQDFLKFIDKENDFLAFRKAADLTRRQVPILMNWLENNVLKCQKYANEWAEILKIVVYFQQNPRPNLYWRQLPLDVDLIGLESLQSLVSELLDATLPPSMVQQHETQFEKRFGLRYDVPLLRLRFLDENEIDPNFGADVSLPLSVIEKLDVLSTDCFILTDKTIFLSFPKRKNTLLLLWDTPSVPPSKIAWLQTKQCFFIGDIVVKGFEQLANLRQVLPLLKSVMMDTITFSTFEKYHETQKNNTQTIFLQYLTQTEQKFYQELLNMSEKNCLLQKSIAHWYLVQQIAKIE